MYYQNFLFLLPMFTNVFAQLKTTINVKQTRNKTRPPISINSNRFLHLISNSDMIVDKSLLIQEILHDQNKVTIISRPARWGKSVNADMIKTFVEATVDQSYNPIIPQPSMQTYRLFVEGEVSRKEKFQKPFLIAKETSLIENHLGRHPVIYVNFQTIAGKNCTQLCEQIRKRLSDAFSRHKYMFRVFRKYIKKNIYKDSQHMKSIQEKLDSFNNILLTPHGASDSDIKNSLRFLSEILQEYFKMSVFIIMDDYDIPINIVHSDHDFPESDKQKFFHFYTDLLVTTFQKNEHLFKGILTGRFPLSKDDLAAGLNGTVEYSFMNEKLIEYYGLQSSEVNDISQILQYSKSISQQIGVSFGKYYFPQKRITMYNPPLIVNFIAGNQFTDSLNIEAMKNYLRFFLQTGVPYFKNFKNAFQLNATSSGHALHKAFLEDGHFTRAELEIFHKALNSTYTEAEFKPKLSKFNIFDDNRLAAAGKSYEKPEFDSFIFLNKVYLFLYTAGYFTMTQANKEYIHMEYARKDDKKRKDILNILFPENEMKTKNKSITC